MALPKPSLEPGDLIPVRIYIWTPPGSWSATSQFSDKTIDCQVLLAHSFNPSLYWVQALPNQGYTPNENLWAVRMGDGSYCESLFSHSNPELFKGVMKEAYIARALS